MRSARSQAPVCTTLDLPSQVTLTLDADVAIHLEAQRCTELNLIGVKDEKGANAYGEGATRYLKKVVGVPGFEPGTSWTQTRRATRLRHTPSALTVPRIDGPSS